MAKQHTNTNTKNKATCGLWTWQSKANPLSARAEAWDAVRCPPEERVELEQLILRHAAHADQTLAGPVADRAEPVRTRRRAARRHGSARVRAAAEREPADAARVVPCQPS